MYKNIDSSYASTWFSTQHITSLVEECKLGYSWSQFRQFLNVGITWDNYLNDQALPSEDNILVFVIVE